VALSHQPSRRNALEQATKALPDRQLASRGESAVCSAEGLSNHLKRRREKQGEVILADEVWYGRRLLPASEAAEAGSKPEVRAIGPAIALYSRTSPKQWPAAV